MSRPERRRIVDIPPDFKEKVGFLTLEQSRERRKNRSKRLKRRVVELDSGDRD